MGLLFVFPTDKNLREEGLVLRSYPLPPLFWIYLLAVLSCLVLLLWASWSPLVKMLHSSDPLNGTLALGVFALFALIPPGLLCVFFYEKSIERKGDNLHVIHRIFGVPLRRRVFLLGKDPFVVRHHLDSPNVAKMEGNPAQRAFYNQGYFVLILKTSEGREVFLDRHGQRKHLEKMATLLSLS